ncbi:energy-coupling factor ABC transporter permease [Thermofilum pendens]|uniref:Cobalamin (Vitamin B12) biosynthesis CbiM protein n=1 Tax=Thermofilum pendens (strain DSM 2475 / Hrk 5) TaxID=368408 RepID=A1S104_THEPD|nr:energy-coupling factor ABC transporter permease [Thermofilum pendens]ABL79134.1 cobalamin (vitamin B12) biosynthesis CbiM protein [Thermofilum pendens Hrk 5]
MHIPDGYLDPAMCAVTYALSLAVLAFSALKARSAGSEQKTLVPVLAAAIFAAQMLNWPIPGGTSLHLVGGALASILVGPWLASLTMFLVLLTQALVFHDGGITTLGANVLNMGIVAVFAGYLAYRAFPERLRVVGAFLAGWLSITLAGVVCGVELGLSKQFLYGLSVTVPVMGGWHALLGVVEGLITASVYAYLKSKAPQLVAG